MFRHLGFYTWADEIAKHLPKSSKPKTFGLALWSFGMTIAQSYEIRMARGWYCSAWSKPDHGGFTQSPTNPSWAWNSGRLAKYY